MEGVLLYLDGTEFFYFCKGEVYFVVKAGLVCGVIWRGL